MTSSRVVSLSIWLNDLLLMTWEKPKHMLWLLSKNQSTLSKLPKVIVLL
jgi:hypothetical protein